MSWKRSPLIFNLRDVKRGYKAAVKAGMPNPRIVIDTVRKTVAIVPGSVDSATQENDLDGELEEFNERHGQG